MSKNYQVKIRDELGFVDFLQILTFNAIFMFIDSVRNTGKTTKAKMLALMRFLKKSKKMLWVRTFEEDTKDIKKNFYNHKIIKLVKSMGYDCELSQISQNGNYIYFRKDKKNIDWFIKIVSLNQAQSLKGNEIEEIDLIVYDEYRTKANRLNNYRGNQAKDFIDIVYSIARSHKVRCLLLGNKETFNNPFYDYLKITPPQDDFDGVKTYKNGSILICQITKQPQIIEQNDTNKKLKDALKDTQIYEYLYKGKTEGIDLTQIKKTPQNAIYMYGFLIDNSQISCYYTMDGTIYFKNKFDSNQFIYTDKFTNKYKFSERIIKDKSKFKLIHKAFKQNKIYFENVSIAERVEKLLKIIGILN